VPAVPAAERGLAETAHALGAGIEVLEAGPRGYRSATSRREATARPGGNLASESAVELGLKWLALHQSEDGRWTPTGEGRRCPSPDFCEPERGGASADAGVTGLALLAFLGAGYGPDEGPHRETVARALGWLEASQHASGFFFDPATLPEGSQGEMYGHGIALLALAEARAMSGDPRWGAPLERAVRATASAQTADGGWTYRPAGAGRRGELTLSVWQMLGLDTALRAGAPGGEAALARARRFLLASHTPGGAFTYTSASLPTAGSTAAGLFAACRLGLGDAVRLDRGLALLALQKKSDPDLGEPLDRHPLYAWYCRTQAAFQAQGRAWRDWNRKIRPFLVSTQRTAGHQAGSWTLLDYGMGGAVYSTALCVLTLETYYRYPPATAGAAVRGTALGPSVDESAPLTREEERRIEDASPPSEAVKDARRRRELAEARRDLRSERPERRYFASRALAEAGDRGSVHAMIAAAGLEEGRLRAAHLLHLGKLKSEQAIAFLEGELEAESADVRSAALSALSTIVGEALADEEAARRLLAARRAR
jgi:hypothetical protein